MTAAIAATIDRIISGDTLPNLLTNLCSSTPRSCNTSTADVFANPFLTSGAIFTCQTFDSKKSFHSVKGATSLIGSTPTASELITTTGRVLRISEPTVGSSVTNHISPRLIVNKISSLPCLAFSNRLLVIGFHLFGLLCQQVVSFFYRQLHKAQLQRTWFCIIVT